jgi:uncharacterized protein YggU (UPF0235/DUF167 family)
MIRRERENMRVRVRVSSKAQRQSKPFIKSDGSDRLRIRLPPSPGHAHLMG